MFLSVSQLFSELTVSAKGQRGFAAILAHENCIQAFLQDDPGKVVAFLAALQNSGVEGQGMAARVLALPRAVFHLAERGESVAVGQLIEGSLPNQQAEILAADDAVRGLVEHGWAEDVWNLICVFDAPQQVRVLAAANAVWALCERGWADEVEALQARLVRRARKEAQRRSTARPQP